MKKIGTTLMAVMIAMMPNLQGRAACPLEDALVTDAAQTVEKDGEENKITLHREVFYEIRSSANDPDNPVMREVAEFMARYPDCVVTITGYADRETGNSMLNKQYAQQRAQQFRTDLVKRFGVDSRRIITESYGDMVQPFNQNAKNRCTIIDAVAYVKTDAPQVVQPQTATAMAEEQRREFQRDKQERYGREMQRHRRESPRTDTIYISRTDTLWLAAPADTLKPERSFGLNKAHRWRNWFITFGGGPGIFQGDHNVDAVWKDRLYPAFNFSIGKWVYPAFGVRARINLDCVHSYYNANPNSPNPSAGYYGEFVHGASPNEPYEKRPWLYRMRYNSWNYDVELMMNFSSFMWGPYNRRIWNLIGYFGVGCIANWDNGECDWFNYAASLNVGILNSFRVSERFDINIDLHLKRFSDKYNCFVQGRGMEGITNLTIGATWYFTKRGF